MPNKIDQAFALKNTLTMRFMMDYDASVFSRIRTSVMGMSVKMDKPTSEYIGLPNYSPVEKVLWRIIDIQQKDRIDRKCFNCVMKMHAAVQRRMLLDTAFYVCVGGLLTLGSFFTMHLVSNPRIFRMLIGAGTFAFLFSVSGVFGSLKNYRSCRDADRFFQELIDLDIAPQAKFILNCTHN